MTEVVDASSGMTVKNEQHHSSENGNLYAASGMMEK